MTRYLQASWTVLLWAVKSVPTVAVSVIAPVVALRQVASPLVWFCALLMEMARGTGFVQAGQAIPI